MTYYRAERPKLADDAWRAHKGGENRARPPATRRSLRFEGAGNRARTDDLLITNQLLYQLSYAGVHTS